MLPPESSLQRFLHFLRGDAEGSTFQRVRFYGFRLLMGAIVGFFIVALATPSRERGGQGFALELYLGAIVAGAALALALTILPRLMRPKDWPTREEFRRGAAKKDDEGR